MKEKLTAILNSNIEEGDVGERLKKGFLLITVLISAMWIFFFIELIFPSLKYDLAIRAKSFSLTEVIGILGSWLSHDNFNHIQGNTISLFSLILFIGMFEKNSFKLILILIISSGIATWLLGSYHTLHLGASGLVYACFGYIVSACFLGKRWIYLIPISLSFLIYGTSYLSSFMDGLIPKVGISFSGHFGGLIAGIIIGLLYNGAIKNKLLKK